MRNITVGVVQMAIKQMPSEVKGSWDGLSKDEIRRIDEEVVSANLDQAEKLVRKTKEQGVDVVLLPELLNGRIFVRSGGTNIMILQRR